MNKQSKNQIFWLIITQKIYKQLMCFEKITHSRKLKNIHLYMYDIFFVSVWNFPSSSFFIILPFEYILMLLQHINEQQIDQLRQAFAVFDKDGDGSISNKELIIVLRSLGHNPTKEELDAFIILIDEDQNGTIDFRQFLILISKQFSSKSLYDKIKEAFSIIDRDQDGKLKRIEIKQLLMVTEQFHIDDIDDLLDQLDENGQGIIDIDSYITSILSNQQDILSQQEG